MKFKYENDEILANHYLYDLTFGSMKFYVCLVFKLEADKVRFVFDGKDLKPFMTPKELGLEDGDQLDVEADFDWLFEWRNIWLKLTFIKNN